MQPRHLFPLLLALLVPLGPATTGEAGEPGRPATETGVLTGRVRNAGTNAHLEGAEISLAGTRYSTLTERDGTYHLSVPPGSYMLTVRYTGLEPQTVPVTIAPGGTARHDVGMAADIYRLSPFVVAGEREGNALAITQQRAATNVKNVVASDAYGDLHDGNIATLLERLPGIAGFNVGGDVRAITIRGISGELNSVTVNGNRMPSAEAQTSTREFEFENVSVDSFETVEVIKSPTPDMEADAIGGAVNLVTKTAFNYGGRRIKIGAGLSYNELGDALHPTGNINYSDIFGGRKQFGVSVNLGYSEHHAINTGPIQQYETKAGEPVYQWQLQMRHPGGTIRTRYNGNVKLDWKPGERSLFSLNLLYNHFEEGGGGPARVLTVQTAQAIAQPGPNGTFIGAGTILPGYTNTVTEARVATTTTATMNTSLATKQGVTWQIQPSGRHTFGPLVLDYDAFYSKGRQKRQSYAGGGGGDITMILRNIGFRIDRSRSALEPAVIQTAGPDMYDYANYVWNGNFVEQDRRSEDLLYGSQLNARRAFDVGVPAELKAGVRFRAQDRMIDYIGDRVSTFIGPAGKLADFRATGDATDPNGTYRAPNFWPSQDKVAWSVLNEPQYWQENVYGSRMRNLSTDGRVQEDVFAYYAQGNVKLNRLTILAGVRVEQTEVEAEAALQDTSVTATTHPDPLRRANAEWGQKARRGAEYRNVFPGVHFVYRMREGLVARLSYATSIGRPAFGTLQPKASANEIDQVLSINNTGLRPQYSDNFDAGLEYYFEPVGVLSANVFLKEINDFIFNTAGSTIPAGANNGFDGEYAGWELRSQANGGTARVRGFEVNYQQQFSFLPGVLRGLGAFANYTRISTKGDFGTGTQQTGTAVPGFIPVTANAGISYNYARFSGRVQWHRRGQYLFAFNANPLLMRYFAAVEYLSLSANYKLTRRVELYSNISNLLNEPRKEFIYQANRPRAYFWNGTRYNAGVNVRF